jgi:serine/threonine protein kinase
MPVLGTALEPLTPQDPRSIGTFRLRARLGSGGMGRVYLGYSPAGRAVAVKVVHPELARDEQFRKRFRREVAAARRVNGAYTAPVIAAGPDDEIPWLATAYVAGPSVADAVVAAGPLPPESVLRLGGGLAEALADIHATDVVHRDLKPSNVMLAADGPRVIDFGISRAVQTSALTTTGVVIGTPGFMAPEQATGDEAGPASDVFSLGAVLAFAATGRAPFGEGSPVSVLFRVVHAEPDLDGIDGPLHDLISRCLAKDPAARPTARDVAALVPVTGLADPTAADAGAGTFWPPALDLLILRYAGRTDEVPSSGAALAADERPSVYTGSRPPETETVWPLTGTAQPTGPSSEGMAGAWGGTPGLVPGRPLPGDAEPPAWPEPTVGRRLPSRGVLAALLVVVVAVCAAGAVVLLPDGGSKPGAAAPAGTPTSHQTHFSVSAPSASAGSSAAGSSVAPSPTLRTSPGATPATSSPTFATSASAPSAPSASAPPPAVTASAPAHQPYPVPALLGTPDWNGYCQATGQGPVTLVTANHAYGWHCTKATTLGDDANAVCAWTFNRPLNQTTNTVTNFYDPNSWQCWSASMQLSAPDWNGYCQATGQGPVTLVTADNAYGWHCTKATTLGDDARAVCAWTNGASTPVVARFQSFYDPNTWQCWV